MQETIAKESSRRRMARRIGAAGLALAAVVTLGACKATGGGQIDEPVPSGVLARSIIQRRLQGDANFGFNFTCEVTAKNKEVIKGEITYHDTGTSNVEGVDFPEIRLHGVVDADHLNRPRLRGGGPAASLMQPNSTAPTGPRTRVCSRRPPGRFNVLVFDQGEPGRTKDPAFVTGDGFSIDLTGWSVPPVHPGWLHRGRQHPGGQHLGTLNWAYPAA